MLTGTAPTPKEDGDLTDLIRIRGINEVDTSKPAIYYITYVCEDSGGQNTQTWVRIIVEAGS